MIYNKIKMKEEYKSTLDILREQKNKLINQLKDNNISIETSKIIIENISFIDDKIKTYNENLEKIE